MTGVDDQIRQRDLVPAIATVATAAGWHVVNLHKGNPSQTSLPDLMLTKADAAPIMVKALGPRGKLSIKQQAFLEHFRSCGFRCLSFRPEQIAEVFEVLT